VTTTGTHTNRRNDCLLTEQSPGVVGTMPNWEAVYDGIVANALWAVLPIVLGGFLAWWKWIRGKVYIKSVYGWKVFRMGPPLIVGRFSPEQVCYACTIVVKNTLEDDVALDSVRIEFNNGKGISVKCDEVGDVSVKGRASQKLEILEGFTHGEYNEGVYSVWLLANVAETRTTIRQRVWRGIFPPYGQLKEQ
jgi:hypothetical protein